MPEAGGGKHHRWRIRYGFGLDPSFLSQGLIWLSGFVGGVALDLVKDLIKERVKEYLKKNFLSEKKPKSREFEIDAVKLASGCYLIVIREKE